MTQLSDINIEVVTNNDPVSPSPQAMALLQELQGMLNDLVHTGKSTILDIRSLPLTPNDYAYLKSLLGEGEVTATINALGPTTISETEIPGIWWVTHYNADDMVLAENIEVTELPEILKTQGQDLQQAIALLKLKTDEIKDSLS